MNKKLKTNKKAVMAKSIVELAIAALVIVVIIVVILKITALLDIHAVKCENKAEWQSIRAALKEIEDGRHSIQIPFYNKDCYLTSFTPTRFETTVTMKRILDKPDKPALCLCKISGRKCDPYECFELSTFTEINGPEGEQYTTKAYKPYMFITFTRDNEKLAITDIKKRLEIITRTYEYSPEYEKLDPAHLLHRLEITFKLGADRFIEDFLPKVTLLETPILLPTETNIEKIGEFPILFDITLLEIPKEDSQELIAKPESAQEINLDWIEKALIELLVDKSKIDILDPELQGNIRLYRQREGEWFSTKMHCSDSEYPDKYLCSATIWGFAKKFAISTKKFIPCDLVSPEDDLMIYSSPCISADLINKILSEAGSPAAGTGDIIYGLAEDYGIDPAIALAFFRQESFYGTKGITKTLGTKNPGNMRPGHYCTKHGGTRVASKTGWYCKFPSWGEGFEAWFDLITTSYHYRDDETVEEIAPTYCPPADDPACEGYAQNIKDYTNEYRGKQATIPMV